MTWTDPVLVAGPSGTHIRKVHITEIRAAIDGHFGVGGAAHPIAIRSSVGGGADGFMSATMAEQLATLVATPGGVASVGVQSPITNTGTATSPVIGFSLASATSTTTGLMDKTDKAKLDAIAAQATKNQTDAYLMDRQHHTGTQSADTLTNGTNNKVFSTADKTKLDSLQNPGPPTIMKGDITMFWPLTGAIEDYFFFGGTNDGKGKTVAQGSPQDMSDWALCNGKNGTPDFRDRFPLCAGNRAAGIKSQTLIENPSTLYPGEEKHTSTIEETPDHDHLVDFSNHNARGTDGGGYVSSGGGDGSQEAITAFKTQSTGGGKAHNNMPPYITCWYKIKIK